MAKYVIILLLLWSTSLATSFAKKGASKTCLKPYGTSLSEFLDVESCGLNSSSEEEEFYKQMEYEHIRNFVDGYNFYGTINHPGEGGLGAPCASNRDCDTERLLICNENKVCECDTEASIASQLNAVYSLPHPLPYSKWNETCKTDTDCENKAQVDNNIDTSDFLAHFYPLRCNEHGRCDCGSKSEDNAAIYAGLCDDLCTCKVGTCSRRLDFKSPTRHTKAFLYPRDPSMEPPEID